jgi:aa3 type cytochrome c oxidase subunit IV
MADHGEVEYATAEGNDLPAHVAMYDHFVHWIVVGGAHVANIVLGLAIGAVTGHWLVAFAIFVVATIVAFHGFLSGARMPSVVMVILSLIALALTSGG